MTAVRAKPWRGMPVGLAWLAVVVLLGPMSALAQTVPGHAPAASPATATAPADLAANAVSAPQVPALPLFPPSPNPLWLLPFVGMLAAIALMPFINLHWWERNYPWVSLALASVGFLYYVAVRRDPMPWLHEMEEYVSFISLLGALFFVSGGIAIGISRRATPALNSMLLVFGAVIANLVGTTGASMLLIRPYLAVNRNHIKPYHVIFFIFVVSNAGGVLTPIGDPPLFLGYLRGVPFWWVLEQCWPMWLVVVGALVAVFFVLDTLDHRKTARHHEHDGGPAVTIRGMQNVLFILVVVGAVFRNSVFEAVRHVVLQGATAESLLGVLLSRELLMWAAALASAMLTPKTIYEHNRFTSAPIREVALLFIGIFSTMVPALEYLEARARNREILLQTPGQFYFGSGALSSVLDNAPTYATFLQTRLGEIPAAHLELLEAEVRRLADPKVRTFNPNLEPIEVRRAVAALDRYHHDAVLDGTIPPTDLGVKVAYLLGNPDLSAFIVAISLGSVFFGACTYIGNGPNFMVKSIAESSGVKMPTFFGYVVRYALPVLIPVYVLVWAIFLR